MITHTGPQDGFGLGALNDADEDDLDVYDHATGPGRSRHAFDTNDMHDEERVVIGGRGAKPGSTTLPTPSVRPCQLLEEWVKLFTYSRHKQIVLLCSAMANLYSLGLDLQRNR